MLEEPMLPAAYFRDNHLLVSLGDGRDLSCHDVSSNDLIMSEEHGVPLYTTTLGIMFRHWAVIDAGLGP